MKLTYVPSISVIIPTYNRAEDLAVCLDTLLNQTIKPIEIIIVDDSDNEETLRLICQRKNKFKNIDIELKYIKNYREKSSAVARNIGIEEAKGEIILFLDDDVILMNDYIERILEIYQDYPDCLGVQGYIIQRGNFSKIDNIICKISFRSYIEKNSCRVLPSLGITHPYPLDKITKCEWMTGSNQSYRAHVLQKFRFDENLKRYAWLEDVDLSYRVYKQHNGGLYITPYARLIHKISPRARIPQHHLIYVKEAHSIYLFFKIIDLNLKNIAILIWSKLIFLLIKLCVLIIRPYKDARVKYLEIKYLIDVYILCLKHIEDIKNDDLMFLNRLLIEKSPP